MSDTSNNRLRLFDALNKQTGMNLSRRDFLDNFTLSDPQKPITTLPRKNTFVKLNPNLDSKFYGIKTIWYNRIHVNELGTIIVTRTTEQSLVDLLPQINEKYNLVLTASDIINQTLLPSQVGTFILVLPIDPTSLMFYDGAFIPTIEAPNPPNTNTYPAGTLIRAYCTGYDKYGAFSDGLGGEYTQLLQANSADCGYDPDGIIYLVIDGGQADTDYIESWQTAGEAGAG